MVKIIAGILLFLGCTVLGFSKASTYKTRRTELENTLELYRKAILLLLPATLPVSLIQT